MDEMQELNMHLYNEYLNQYEKSLVNSLKDEFINKESNYSLTKLWEYDLVLGGIGCYSMPADPKKNPFAGGDARYMFRPLQYVRCKMELLNLNYTARDVIRDIGLHLEFVTKYLLKKNRKILFIANNKGTLGTISHKLNKSNLITRETYDCLKNIIKIYNISKHDINIDENRHMSFTPVDAIVFYIVSRKLSLHLLNSYYEDIYESLGERIKCFYINYDIKEDVGFLE